MRKILAFAVITEIGTGFVLLIDPALVVALLIGGDLGAAGAIAGRCFGLTLVALSVACWPTRPPAAPAVRGMLLYNAAIALYLAYLGTAGHLGGVLLWPAAALHAIVAVVLVVMWRRESKTAANAP